MFAAKRINTKIKKKPELIKFVNYLMSFFSKYIYL